MKYMFENIGHIRSCFKEKFGIPRQPSLVPDAEAFVCIDPAFQRAEAFQALEDFSHIWLLIVFHQCQNRRWRTTVRPPRLGGNQRVGVFASRSGFRPNPIGQSVVELVAIEMVKGALQLRVKGADLLDGTPVLDIKPYLPYADSLPHAKPGYAGDRPQAGTEVIFAAAADLACRELENETRPNLRQLIIDLLALDPRPGYADNTPKRHYGMRLWDLDVKFIVESDRFVVNEIRSVDQS